ncbi:MAG: SagB/ThcOx family dehydrogenase [Proteobacteria bacterium]|nr:SagB/ThcOx family dehydrogenase [Pseudomonadota bacterium]MBU4357197.1 SagB/ThcOx family dehydrogenase [Pseudomonadota bacterium]
MKILLSLSMVLWFPLATLAAGYGAETIKLPPPVKKGALSVEEVLQGRRSTRRFANRSLELAQISQLLWAADGINSPQGKRTAPSARGTYPMDLYLVVGERGVTGLAPGAYHYNVADHSLELVAKGEFRSSVGQDCNRQAWMAEAPVMVVITGEPNRCTAKSIDRGIRYTHMEAGFLAQNLFLQAGALGLGAGIVGGFDDRSLAQTLKLPQSHEPLLVMPLGYKS